MRMLNLSHIKQEIIGVIPAVIYFCIVFNLIFFTTGLALRHDETRDFSYLTVNLGALIVGKVLILANQFPFIDAFPNKPLIYNIVWKFCIYNICVVLFWAIEECIHLSYKYDNFLAACDKLRSDILSPLFWSTQLWLYMVFLVFILFHEFACAIGKNKVKKMLLG
jgi:hypothetical protein